MVFQFARLIPYARVFVYVFACTSVNGYRFVPQNLNIQFDFSSLLTVYSTTSLDPRHG